MKVLAAGGAGILALIVLTAALSTSDGAGASTLSPALAAAPPGLVAVAFQAGQATSIDPNVLLAIAKVETDWGQARNAQPDDLVPGDIRAKVDAASLQAVGARSDRHDARAQGWQAHRRLGERAAARAAQEHAVGLEPARIGAVGHGRRQGRASQR